MKSASAGKTLNYCLVYHRNYNRAQWLISDTKRGEKIESAACIVSDIAILIAFVTRLLLQTITTSDIISFETAGLALVNFPTLTLSLSVS